MVPADLEALCEPTIALALELASRLDAEDGVLTIAAPTAGTGASPELAAERDRRAIAAAATVFMAVEMLPIINGHRHALTHPADGHAGGWSLRQLDAIEVAR